MGGTMANSRAAARSLMLFPREKEPNVLQFQPGSNLGQLRFWVNVNLTIVIILFIIIIHSVMHRMLL